MKVQPRTPGCYLGRHDLLFSFFSLLNEPRLGHLGMVFPHYFLFSSQISVVWAIWDILWDFTKGQLCLIRLKPSILQLSEIN